MALTGKKIKKYDEKECWDKFMEMGAGATIRKLNNWHTEKYGFASQMGPYWAMWRYACKNVDQAFGQYKVWWFETASAVQNVKNVPSFIVTKEDFLKDCRNHIIGSGNIRRDSVLSQRAYRKFCQENGLEE